LSVFGQQFERSGDYFRWLNEFERPRLALSREIGDRLEEGFALMHCGHIEALYLGDYAPGLGQVEESLRKTESLTSRLYPLLRLIQIHTELGNDDQAQSYLEEARPISEETANLIGRAGFSLVAAILYIRMGGEERFNKALELTSQVEQMVQRELVSRQYLIGAHCLASAAHLELAALREDGNTQADHLRQALEYSQRALDAFTAFGFVQTIECSTEEVYYRHSLALAANGRTAEAKEMSERSYGELMRKYELIPADSRYRKTFLAIKLHQQITRLAGAY
jgi:tetratricopeptide (TPR) repeat protein